MIHNVLAGLGLAVVVAAQQRIALDGEWQRDGGTITVPAAFETAMGVDFDGVVTYRRALPLPARRVQHARVEFAAVATHAVVYCNGQRVGEHLGGWTPFRVELTDQLQWTGNDVLEVRVDEKVGHNTQGFLPIIQPHFGGIWQGVTLCLDDGPVIDRLGLLLFGRHRPIAFGQPPTSLEYDVPVLDVTDDVTVLVETLGVDGRSDGSARGEFAVRQVELWHPASPRLYDVRVSLHRSDVELDRVERKVGFRSLLAFGTKVLWNGEPLQLRGILHWGYSPPHLAPPTDPAWWRRQITDFKSLGFNCIKCCLWVPPRCLYELCDELGMIVWQEYPTWHPKLDQAHKQELLTEYGEFFRHDRNHASVAFRSITCETGPGADLDVVKALFDACKAAVPDTLVVDDSSWIGWQRITDFWDEHPYGNNSWFPGRLEDFKRHIAQNREKPLLLGECIAADTWVDRAGYAAAHGDGEHWWRPWCWDSQIEAEKWLVREFGQQTLDSLLPLSLEFGMRNRKFQIEQLRLSIPDAGYVVSVARDFGKARMGLYDDTDRLKWSAQDWSWHRDTMLCLDLPHDGRAQSAWFEREPDEAECSVVARVRVSHFGQGKLDGKLRLWTEAPAAAEVTVPVKLLPGSNGDVVELRIPARGAQMQRVTVRAELTGSHAAINRWNLWYTPVWNYRGHPEVKTASRLTPELLTEIENGARVLLLAGGTRPGAIRTERMWFLKGAPFAPPHPVHAALPREALLELSSFDLETERVVPWDGWKDQVDPILAFWETHDIRDTRLHLHAFDTRIGKGRLLVTTLDVGGPVDAHTFGFHAGYVLTDHLAVGPAPERALTDATIAALRQKLTEKKLDLPTWRFRTDPEDAGRAAEWYLPTTDTNTAAWRDLQAGSHWENQGEDLQHFTGVAWYVVTVYVPEDWDGLDARAVFEGVDDSFECWLNGESVGRFGDPATEHTIWLERQTAELGRRLKPGQANTITLRVVDHMGAGGLWKPVFLTTGPIGRRSRLLH